jgi:hypothetical protein
VFDAFFGIKSFESFLCVLAEGIRQFAKFAPEDMIMFCRFIFEFVRRQAIITPEQARARQLAAELEEAQVRIRAGQQCIDDLKTENEELKRQLAENSSDWDDLSRRYEDEKAGVEARSRVAQGKLKRQIRTLKETEKETRFRVNMQTGKLKQELSELQAEFFRNLPVENWVEKTDELAHEVMRLMEDRNQPRYSGKLNDFPLILSTYSATGYQLLRKVIPLPSRQALHSQFRDTIKEREDQLSQVCHLQSLLGDFLEMDESSRPAVVIGVDAVSVSNTFVGMTSVTREGESFMFLLNLQPICPDLPCRPIHVLGSETAGRSIQR